jgi:hypothetical protein
MDPASVVPLVDNSFALNRLANAPPCNNFEVKVSIEKGPVPPAAGAAIFFSDD